MIFANDIRFGGYRIGQGQPAFVIAEIGVNHNGNLRLAFQLIDAAAKAGANAAKFQSFRASRLAIPGAPKAAYQTRNTGGGSQLDMLRPLELSIADHRRLINHCHRRKILFLSSCFDQVEADLLEALHVPAFKVPSGELTNLPLLSHIARKGRPMIVSTGMSSLKEVGDAVGIIQKGGGRQLILLHCVSDYPANPAEANLLAMKTLAESFRTPVGFSDHTPGIEVSLAAVTLGAVVIEKHLTLDRSLPGPDHLASLEPAEFDALVRGIRIVESSLGDGNKRISRGERATVAVARKSFVAIRDIPVGTRLSSGLVELRRPGTGLPPTAWPKLRGRITRRRIPAMTPLSWNMFT